MIWKIWKKSKLNSEMIWKIQKKSKCRVVFWIDKNGLNVSNQSHHWKWNQLDDIIQYPEQQQYTFTQGSSNNSRHIPQSSSSSHHHNHYSSSSSSSSSHGVEIPPKTPNKRKQNETKISHINVNIYDKTATSQPNSEKI